MLGGLGWFLVTDVSGQPNGPIWDETDIFPLKLAQKGCPDTSVTTNLRHVISQKSAKAWDFIVYKPSFIPNTLTSQVIFFWVMASCSIVFVLTFRSNMLPLHSGWQIGSSGRCDEPQDHHLSNICSVIMETYIVNKGIINHWRAKSKGSKFASVHDLKAYGETRCIAPFVPYVGTRWRCTVSLMPWPLLFCGKSPLYLLLRRLGGSQSRSGRFAEEKNLLAVSEFESWIIQPVL